MYAELHCHTNYSFQEGASSTGDLLVRAEELGYPALAITDHDNLCGAMEFAQVAADLRVQAIIGAEITLKGSSHLTLLAETQKGYGNLSRLISQAHFDGDRRDPRLDPRHLPGHAEGLVLLTGCRGGQLPGLLHEGRFKEAEALLRSYLDWFGSDNVFVELQQNLVYGDTVRNRRLIDLAGSLGVGVVATNNVHYHVPERHRLQDALVAIRHNKTLEETHRERRPNGQFYLKTASQMTELFDGCSEAIENTVRIAERCQFDLTKHLGYRFPDYPAPEGHTPKTFLRQLCYEAAMRRYGGVNAKVDERLQKELHLIEKNDLAGFFLIYHDIIQLAREIMIELGLSEREIPLEERPPGRGRGSSVAMLVGYLIGLSHIDPLEFDLSLDRFLNEEMEGVVPDIDLDFPRNIREELIKRVHKEWGPDRAVLTGMISTYKIKGAIRDLGKALGLPSEDLDKLAKRVDSHRAGALDSEMSALPEFRDRVDAPVWRDLIGLSKQLDGFPKYLAQHPGGMILGSSPLTDYVPVQPSAMEDRYVCHWDKDSIDDAGFVKIDFLALGALSQMQDCLQLIEKRTGHYIDLSRIDFEDMAVYDSLHRADTVGVFQVESAAQMQTIPRIKPVNLTDMAYEVGAVRPGVGVNDGVSQFIKRRSQGIPWEYDHPLEARALERTLGVILFQDQLNQIAVDVAGFSAVKANKLRLTFNRRNNQALLERFRADFMEGAASNGVSPEVAEKIFGKFNGHYMFPEAHAFAFGATAYHMAWLKFYYPLEFSVAIFNQQPMGFYNLETLKEDAKRHGIDVLNPDINRSMEKCTISEIPLNPPFPKGETFGPPFAKGGLGGVDSFSREERSDEESGVGSIVRASHVGLAQPCQILRFAQNDSKRSAQDDNERSGPVLSPRGGELERRLGVSRGGSGPLDCRSEERSDEESGAGSMLWSSQVGLTQPRQILRSAQNDSKGSAQDGSERSGPVLSPRGGELERRLGESEQEALLLGFLNVKGVGESAATTIVEARESGGPFMSLADAMRRTGLHQEAIESLVMAGAFDSLAPDRRAALWEVGLRYRPGSGQQTLDLPVEQDMAALDTLSDWESMAGEYRTLGLYPAGHLMAKLRPTLGPDVVPSDEVPHMKDGMEVTVAGLVIRRQRPLAKAVFLTLEDEFGHAPIVVWPKTYERYRLVIREPVLKVRGVVSRREGTMNIVLSHAETIETLRHLPEAHSWR